MNAIRRRTSFFCRFKSKCIIAAFLLACRFAPSESKYLLDKPGCRIADLQKIDKMAAKLMGFGEIGRNFPENFNELKPYCSESEQMILKIENFFKRCYLKEIRDIANVFIYSLRQNIRQFCRKRTKKLRKLLSIAPCINRELIKEDACLIIFNNQTLRLIPWKGKDTDKIHHTCCNYVDTFHCMEDYIDRYPCIRNDKALLTDFVRGIFGGFSDFMCGDYNDSTDRCDKLGPAPVKGKFVPKRKYYSFMFVLLDLLESFKNFHAPV